MGKVTNVDVRVIHVGGVMLVPGVESEMPDEAMQNPVVKSLIEGGKLITGEATPKRVEQAEGKAETAAKERLEADADRRTAAASGRPVR